MSGLYSVAMIFIVLVIFSIMPMILLMMAAMKKNFFPVPGSLEGGKHLLLCGDDEQQPRGQAAVGVQL